MGTAMGDSENLQELRTVLTEVLGLPAATSRLESLGEGFSSRVLAAGDTIIRIPSIARRRTRRQP